LEEYIASVFTYRLKTETAILFETFTNFNKQFQAAYVTTLPLVPKAKRKML
jgi:hypothetical protein